MAVAPDLERLAHVITRRTGLAFPPARLPFLTARARAVMAWAGSDTWDRWLAELEASADRDGTLPAELEEALQVHETCFFRYPGHHGLLADLILPDLAVNGPSRIRVLSVGCSTGQEPYSLAMTVLEHLAADRPRPVEILGVDVGRAALAAARRGVYGPRSVAGVPPLYLERYFVPEEGGYRVAPEVRSLVRFLRYDIRRDFYLGKFDLVVCCNVLLYFTRATREQIMARLTTAVRHGGYLLLGHVEGVTPSAEHFRPIFRPAGVAYQRQ